MRVIYVGINHDTVSFKSRDLFNPVEHMTISLEECFGENVQDSTNSGV